MNYSAETAAACSTERIAGQFRNLYPQQTGERVVSSCFYFHQGTPYQSVPKLKIIEEVGG